MAARKKPAYPLRTYGSRKRLQSKIFGKRNKRRYEELKRLYGYLRSAIELLISDNILCGVTTRYEPDIEVTRFEKIKFDMISEVREQLMTLYADSCAI